eukprot:GDKJ01039749.1.p1 GENE.GDKJ01039749.1~~GDKJ01039749.1.p1  ORF type:complete len:447 (-),score=70.79 GDKJ01039749.1:102-1277(-)
MKMLYDEGFPVPKPIDQNRHAVVMEYINGVLLNNIQTMLEAQEVYERALKLMVKLAEHGLIHGDFNEFNIIITEDLKVIMIDFPQMVSTDHPNASELFDRDVKNLTDFFLRRFRIPTPYYPKLEKDITRTAQLDRLAMASGHFTKKMQAEMDQLLKEQERGGHTEESDLEGDAESADEDETPSEGSVDVPDDEDATAVAKVHRTAEEIAAAKSKRRAEMRVLQRPTGDVEEELAEPEEEEEEEEEREERPRRMTKQELKAAQAAAPRAPRKIKIVSRSKHGVTTVATVDPNEVVLPSKPLVGSPTSGEEGAEVDGDAGDKMETMTTATEARARLRTTAKVDIKEVTAKVKRIGIREDDREFSKNLHRNTQKGREKSKIKNQLKSASGADFF